MSKEFENLLLKLQHYSPKKMIGAVKTFPLRELVKTEQQVEQRLQQPENGQSFQQAELQVARDKLQLTIQTRLETAQKLVAKFVVMSPEVIALKTSIFSLVPSRDLLEDVRLATVSHDVSLEDLLIASTNVLEAVNIGIQQRFYQMSPENIAVSYSEESLDSYRKLLKNLLPHIEVDSDIFRIYSNIIRNVIEGSRIYESFIGVSRAFCLQIFASEPPDFEGMFNSYTIGELENQHTTLQSTIEILQHDITRRPSILEFEQQCRQTLLALSQHFISRKVSMRKTTRVLQLSHYISFIEPERISENASTSLMLCQVLFDEISDFLVSQKGRLDVTLNLTSVTDALKKVMEALRYRQFAIGQLFLELSRIPVEDLSVVAEKRLGDSNLLFQEIRYLVDDFLHRTPIEPDVTTRALSKMLRETIQKLHDAMIANKNSASRPLDEEPWEYERALPNLSKFYDKELVELIRKALTTDSRSTTLEDGEKGILKASSIIPLSTLQDYIESFLEVTKFRERM
ncbi:MAG: hypothetical protein GY801_23800 [bacterium]|nr:hypothetical protein [bacterium]